MYVRLYIYIYIYIYNSHAVKTGRPYSCNNLHKHCHIHQICFRLYLDDIRAEK